MVKDRVKTLTLATAAFLAIVLIIRLFLQIRGTPLDADDLCLLAEIHRSGAIQATRIALTEFVGRWSAAIFHVTSLLFTGPSLRAWPGALLLIALFFAAAAKLARRYAISAPASALFALLVLSSIPRAPESVFWLAGGASYFWPWIWILAALAARKPTLQAIALALAAGSNEAMGAALIAAAAAQALIASKEPRAARALPLAGAVVGLIGILLCPGTWARVHQASRAPQIPPNHFVAFHSIWEALGQGRWHWIVIALAASALVPKIGDIKKFTTITAAYILGYLAPSIALGAALPERTLSGLSIPCALIAIALGARIPARAKAIAPAVILGWALYQGSLLNRKWETLTRFPAEYAKVIDAARAESSKWRTDPQATLTVPKLFWQTEFYAPDWSDTIEPTSCMAGALGKPVDPRIKFLTH